MDQVFVSGVLQRVRENVLVLAGHVREDGSGTKDDMADVAVVRRYAHALLDAGATPAELALAGEVLQRASDVMTFHRSGMRFALASDRLAWSYAGLYLRLLALAFTECGAPPNDLPDHSVGGLDLSQRSPTALRSLAAVLHLEAVDRLTYAIDRSLELATAIADDSPFVEGSAELIEAYNLRG